MPVKKWKHHKRNKSKRKSIDKSRTRIDSKINSKTALNVSAYTESEEEDYWRPDDELETKEDLRDELDNSNYSNKVNRSRGELWGDAMLLCHEGKNKIKHKKENACTGSDLCYSMPNSKLLTILIVVLVLIVLVFLTIFRLSIYPACDLNDSTNGSVSIYLTMVALPVGVTLSFIVASVWATYADAQIKEASEASQLFVLYKLIGKMSGTKNVRKEIKDYIRYIIDIEFPLFADCKVGESTGFDRLVKIGEDIYLIEPEGDRECAIFSQCIDVFQNIVQLRITRDGYASNGLAPELWWVLVFGVAIVIFMSFFVYMRSFGLQMLMVGLAVATLVSLLFIILALDCPYRGDFGLNAVPFALALASMEKLKNK